MAKRTAAHIFLTLSFMLISMSANAKDGESSGRPYALSGFSGSCKSVGIWTREALQLTDEIRNFTLQLKNDPNCQALGQKMQASLRGLAEQVEPKIAERYTQRLAQLQQEVSTLANYVRTSRPQMSTSFAAPSNTPQTEHALFKAVVQYGEATAYSAAAGGGSSTSSGSDPLMAPASRLGDRFMNATRDGLSLFNEVIDSIPQMQQCLTGDGVTGGNVISTSVKLLTAFVASGQDTTGTSVATALSKLSQVMRETKFANVLTKLNKADFISSISCLIEISTENYCNTRDSKLLFDDMMKQLQARPRESEQKRLGPQHALAGYYILTQNLPIITNWVQRVQIGVDPRVDTDAIFQNKIFDEVNNFFKKTKTLQGYMEKEIEAMRLVPELKGRQSAARDIVIHVTNMLSGGLEDGGGKNFFTLNGSSRELMFLLLGIPMPKEVTGAGGGMAQEPSQWLENNYMTLKIFEDPERVVRDAKGRIFGEDTGMIATAKKNVILYYNKWFIIDKISLVNESLLGMNYNVKDSLVLIYKYLGEVEKRLRASPEDLAIIGGLRDTRTRIKNILLAYRELEDVTRALPQDSSTLTKEDREKVTAANIRVITAVYEEFDVLLGKSGWFSNRFIKFVQQDYITMLKSRRAFNENVSDLAYAAGLAIFDRLMTTAESNPANVQSDLASALTLNKMNLESIELLVRDYFANMTAELQAVAKASKTSSTYTNSAIKADGPSRAWRDQMAILPGQEGKGVPFSQRVKARVAFWNEALGMIPGLDFIFGGDPKYAKSRDSLSRFAVDDEFGSAQRLFEQFCIQSLAFSDVRSFYSTCLNVVLKSPLPEAALTGLNNDERQSLNIAYKEKLSETRDNAPKNLSQRICAFRDYNRKNLVVYLTAAQKNSAP